MRPKPVRVTSSQLQPEMREQISELFHELNQPLTTLGCFLELCAKNATSKSSGDFRVAFEQVQAIVKRTTKMRELLGLADRPKDHTDLRLLRGDRVK